MSLFTEDLVVDPLKNSSRTLQLVFVFEIQKLGIHFRDLTCRIRSSNTLIKQPITNYTLVLLFSCYNSVRSLVSSGMFRQSTQQSYCAATKLKQEQDSYSSITPAGPNSKAFAGPFKPSPQNGNALIWTS